MICCEFYSHTLACIQLLIKLKQVRMRELFIKLSMRAEIHHICFSMWLRIGGNVGAVQVTLLFKLVKMYGCSWITIDRKDHVHVGQYYKYVHTSKHSCMHAQVYSCKHTCTHLYLILIIHIYIYMFAHTCIY